LFVICISLFHPQPFLLVAIWLLQLSFSVGVLISILIVVNYYYEVSFNLRIIFMNFVQCQNKMQLKTLCLITLTHWLLEFFAKNAFFDILEILSLDMSQISSNLLKGIYNIIACLSFFPLTLRFATFLLSHAQKSNYAYLRLQWADHTPIWVSLERSFPPAECELYDANFGQRWCCQNWHKGQCSSRPVTGGARVNGLSTLKKMILKSVFRHNYSLSLRNVVQKEANFGASCTKAKKASKLVNKLASS